MNKKQLVKAEFSLKYHSSGSDEFQPGAGGRVLRNLLEITSVREINKIAFAGYIAAESKVISQFTKDQRLIVSDIHQIHKWFLGEIYAWAGTLRSVNITKDGFTFATAYALPTVLDNFEAEVLSVHTPCHEGPLEIVARHIAVVQCELLLMHPYREGNGRTARLLASLMAYQAGLPGIDFSFIKSRGKELEGYVSAIQRGVKKDYAPMARIVLRALHTALRRTGVTSAV